MNRFVVVHSLPSYTIRLLISIVCSWLNINYAIAGSFCAFIFRFHGMAQTKNISLRYGTVYTTVYSCGGHDSRFLVLILKSNIITYFDWCTVLEGTDWFPNALRTDVTWLKGNFFLFISFYQLLNGFEQLPTDKFDTVHLNWNRTPKMTVSFLNQCLQHRLYNWKQVTPHLLINFF
jgi:hypothetical protein